MKRNIAFLGMMILMLAGVFAEISGRVVLRGMLFYLSQIEYN